MKIKNLFYWVRGLQKLVHNEQRCLWYIPHDLRLLMKYQDKAKQEDVNYAMDKVSSIFQIGIPNKDFEKVETQDLVEINAKIHACEDVIRNLSVFLFNKGYSQAATYLANAKDDLFTYLRY